MRKRIVSLLLALVMALTLTLPAYAEGTSTTTTTVKGNVSYMDWNGSQLESVTKTLTYTVVEDSTTTDAVTWGEAGKTTYYVVNDTKVIDGTVTVYGDVHLILCDGKTLTVEKGVVVNGGDDGKSGKLTIYGQSDQSGKLVTKGNTGNEVSGGIKFNSYGPLTINGGIINATGGDISGEGADAYSYGIYGTYVVINNGTVEATGGKAVATSTSTSDGNAYSGGIYAYNMAINGGEVTATGGTATGASSESFGIQADLTVNGGTVTAKGGTAKATGTEEFAYSYGIFVAEDMTVEGENTTVNATGGAAKTTGEGSGAYSYGICAWNDIDVNGGTVDAYGGKVEVTKDAEVTEDAEATDEDNHYHDFAESYGIYAYNGVTIKNARVTAEGNEANGHYASSFGIYTENDITFENATIFAEGETANGAYTAYSYGICAYYNYCDSDNDSNLTITKANITAKGETAEVENAGEGTDAKGYGIFVAKDMIVEGERTTVNATGGTASSTGDDAGSYGICVNKNLTIEDGEVTAKGGEAEAGSWVYSYGISVVTGKLTINGGTVKGTGQDAAGEWAESWGIRGRDKTLTIKGGTVIAETTASNAECNKNALFCDEDYKMPEVYWWRIAETGAYSQFPSTAYTYNDTHTYVEITTTEQETGGSGDDDETLKPPTEDTGTGHKRYYTSNQNADAKSADTYDAGIAAYVVMGGISTVTSAAWLRRRKK